LKIAATSLTTENPALYHLGIMGWFWASEPTTPSRITTPSSTRSQSSNQSRCPVNHSAMPSCPVNHASRQALNPRNNMPNLPNAPIHTTADGAALPTSREASSIPMNAQGEVWQYPSPQQMLNAMSRKGYDGTNPEDVPAMVAVHNWLNEGSWEEILKWEKNYFGYRQSRK
jgi:cytochrome c heme-lyase